MDANYTKGKWEASKSNADNTAIGITSKTSLVATVWISKFYDDCPKQKEAEANAKLIEQAPEMYRVLELMFNKCREGFLELSEGDEAYDELQKLMLGK